MKWKELPLKVRKLQISVVSLNTYNQLIRPTSYHLFQLIKMLLITKIMSNKIQQYMPIKIPIKCKKRYNYKLLNQSEENQQITYLLEIIQIILLHNIIYI